MFQLHNSLRDIMEIPRWNLEEPWVEPLVEADRIVFERWGIVLLYYITHVHWPLEQSEKVVVTHHTDRRGYGVTDMFAVHTDRCPRHIVPNAFAFVNGVWQTIWYSDGPALPEHFFQKIEKVIDVLRAHNLIDLISVSLLGKPQIPIKLFGNDLEFVELPRGMRHLRTSVYREGELGGMETLLTNFTFNHPLRDDAKGDCIYKCNTQCATYNKKHTGSKDHYGFSHTGNKET